MSILKVNTIQDKGGNTLLSSDGAGTISSGGAITNTPSFKAYRTANQSLANNTWTKIEFNVEDYDTDSAYDSSTNYRFTVPTGKGGKYLFCYALNVDDMGDNQRVGIKLYVNGSNNEYTWVQQFSTGGGNLIGRVGGSSILDLSAGDYVEVYGRQNGGASKNLIGGERQEFSGYKLIGV